MDYSNIILEMLDRIKTLEKEVAELKENKSVVKSFEESVSVDAFNIASKRDTTRYLFKGNVFLKNRLVLAIVKDYVNNNPQITINELKTIFDRSLQGSIGVVEKETIAQLRRDYSVRFFTKENEVLRLIDGNAYVCTQWGILNIPNFIARARQLGYHIEEI